MFTLFKKQMSEDNENVVNKSQKKVPVGSAFAAIKSKKGGGKKKFLG